MAEGRTFEEIDQMTVFDLETISRYREDVPSLDFLVRSIAIWAGAYKPAPKTEFTAVTPETRPPDPTSDIRQAFAGMKFPELGEATHVI